MSDSNISWKQDTVQTSLRACAWSSVSFLYVALLAFLINATRSPCVLLPSEMQYTLLAMLAVSLRREFGCHGFCIF